jgi:alpha-methylacyl-CoA racemase
MNPSTGTFAGKRGTNLLDGGTPFYNVYPCKDGACMSVGCLEPQFFKTFIDHFVKALPSEFKRQYNWTPDPSTQFNREEWPTLKNFLELGFKTRTRDAWGAVFMGTDACAVPILTPEEAHQLEYSKQAFPLPHPKIVGHSSNDSGLELVESSTSSLPPGRHTEEILKELGLTKNEYQKLVQDGAIEGSKSKL